MQAAVAEIESRRYRSRCTVLQSIAVCRDEFDPSLNSGVVLSNLGGAFERHVVRKNADGGTPQITTEARDAPGDAASLEIERCPVTLRLEGSAADENDRADCAVLLFLLEGGSKTIDASVAADHRGDCTP